MRTSLAWTVQYYFCDHIQNSGRTVTYTPDSAGRIVSAADGNGTQYVSSATYYASGAEYQRNMPGIYFRNDLNPRLQVSGFYSDNGQTSSFFMNKSYNYGALHQNNGNVMSITNNKDSNRTQTFTYDQLNRITGGWSAANTGPLSWGENYGIDAWGNLMISPMGGKTSGGNFQHAGNGNNQATGLGYDAAGNLTNYTAPGQYVYDPENRIQSTAGVTYTYDADGNRVEKSGGTVSTLYWYGAPGIIAESDLSGTLKSEYVFFNGKRLARIDLFGNTVHYYLSDHLNSTSMVISGTGAVEDESDYSPFGTEYVLASSGLNHYKFTSKERDTESGLDYFGARYYSNAFGRFITPDWAAKATAVPYAEFGNPQSLNLYRYGSNNPMSFVDADGHIPQAAMALAQLFEKIRESGAFTGAAKAVHNWAASGASNGPVPGFVQFPAAVSEASGLSGMGTGTGQQPVLEKPNGTGEKIGYYATNTAPVVLGAVGGLAEGPAAGVIDMTAAVRAPSMIGFSETETGMINQSLTNLSGAGYDLAPLQQLIKADMPPGCCAMSLSTPPTGAALGDGAFASQGMLDHTLEEELLHLGQDLPNQTFGPGTAAAKEAEVNASRKFPEPK